jgi:hypothetical protein
MRMEIGAGKKNFLSAVDSEWDPYDSLPRQASPHCPPALLHRSYCGGMKGWPYWHAFIWERLVVNWILKSFSILAYRNMMYYFGADAFTNCEAILPF